MDLNGYIKMTIKSIIYSALIIIGLIFLIQIGVSVKEKTENVKFKILNSQVEELK